MELRESIAYNIDLIKGDKKELVKQKPKAPTRGIATVELFDSENGEKIYEAKTENIINNYVSKIAYMDYFYGKIKGNRANSYYSAPFQNIVLTSYSGDESADIKYYKGELIFTDFNDSVAFLNESKKICYLNNNVVKTTPITINTAAAQRHLKYRPDDNEIGYTLEQIKQDGTNVTLTIGKYSIGAHVGAQTLLAAPVTKTPTNTMKIQYDFQIQKVL